MKKIIAFALLFIAALAFAADVAAPVTTTKLARIQTDPNSPDPLTATATAYYETTTTIGGQVFTAPWVSVSWKLADTTKTVSIEWEGKTITLPYAAVSLLVTAVADAEKALKDNPPPAPEAAPAPQTNP